MPRANDTSPRQQRVTLKKGRNTRTFVLFAPPYASLGDRANIDGETGKWTVSKVEELDSSKTFSITFPAKRKAVHK